MVFFPSEPFGDFAIDDPRKIFWHIVVFGLLGDAEREAQNKYEGLQVGSISAPNNNAGNWE